jgi:hypothetical protein
VTPETFKTCVGVSELALVPSPEFVPFNAQPQHHAVLLAFTAQVLLVAEDIEIAPSIPETLSAYR